jgi:hypothetical protein
MFKKGKPRPPNAGRKKGSVNKLTASAREAYALTFQGIGGVPAFIAWAKENPTEFYKLHSKTIPLDVTSGGKELAGLTWSFGDRKVTF